MEDSDPITSHVLDIDPHYSDLVYMCIPCT